MLLGWNGFPTGGLWNIVDILAIWRLLYCDLFHCPFVGIAIYLLVMIYLIIWMHSFFQLISVF